MSTNLTWESEFERRLRRVAGVSDDSLPVSVEGGEMGHCPTCVDYYVTVQVGSATVGFESFISLMRAITDVSWEDVHA